MRRFEPWWPWELRLVKFFIISIISISIIIIIIIIIIKLWALKYGGSRVSMSTKTELKWFICKTFATWNIPKSCIDRNGLREQYGNDRVDAIEREQQK